MVELPPSWLEAARRPPPPADREGDFDFWIGEWECEWDGGRARNSVQKILGGRAVLESFDGSWADNHGNAFQVTGGVRADGAMEIRTSPGRDGSVRRMTFSHIERDGFDWEWAASSGEGFEPLWSLRYTRVGR